MKIAGVAYGLAGVGAWSWKGLLIREQECFSGSF